MLAAGIILVSMILSKFFGYAALGILWFKTAQHRFRVFRVFRGSKPFRTASVCISVNPWFKTNPHRFCSRIRFQKKRCLFLPSLQLALAIVQPLPPHRPRRIGRSKNKWLLSCWVHDLQLTVVQGN